MSVLIEGSGGWECANISPVKIKTDKRYYVIAHAEDGPIYFQYKSGMLPKSVNGVVIEAGVRQTVVSEEFNTEIRKYDYMVFGLVDVRVTRAPETAAGPEISATQPSGEISANSTELTAQASQAAECKFSRDDMEYSKMAYSMTMDGSGVFKAKVCDLEDGNYTFFVRCKNSAGVANNASALINFEVAP